MIRDDVVALYVSPRGPYAGLVETWDAGRQEPLPFPGVRQRPTRDAAAYAGPWPVVAHPPCGPWSRLRHLCGPELLNQAPLGPIAVAQVQEWGGVLEHPRDSALWRACRLPAPGQPPDDHGGWTLLVEQWAWGHRAIKPTWLYIVGRTDTPPIPTPTTPRPAGGGAEARARDPKLRSMLERLPATQRHLTPPALALWLIDLAAGCRPAVRIDP